MVKKVSIKTTKKNKKTIDQAVLDNFVSLQKVLTNLAVKLDGLSDQIAKLLTLFELSAKNFAEKQAGKEIKNREKDKEFLEKLNSLLDQNKTIARGLTLMEEKIRQRMGKEESMPVPVRPVPMQRTMPAPIQMPSTQPQLMQPQPRSKSTQVREVNEGEMIPSRETKKK